MVGHSGCCFGFCARAMVFAVMVAAHGKISRQAEDATYRAYRILTHGIFVMLVVFFLAGERIINRVRLARLVALVCVCQRLHFTPTNSCHVILPLRRMPTSAMAKHAHRKAVRMKQNFRKARVCCELCGLISATEDAPVQRNTSGKASRTARRTAKLVRLAIPCLNRQSTWTFIAPIALRPESYRGWCLKSFRWRRESQTKFRYSDQMGPL
jgi:hypothetical protein